MHSVKKSKRLGVEITLGLFLFREVNISFNEKRRYVMAFKTKRIPISTESIGRIYMEQIRDLYGDDIEQLVFGIYRRNNGQLSNL